MSKIQLPKADTPSAEEKLDEIVLILRKMNKRDQARMITSMIHTVVWALTGIFFLWSSWYFLAHMDEFIGAMSDKVILQMTGGEEAMNQPSMIERLMNIMGQ